MSQGEGLRLGFCPDEHCLNKGKRVELAEHKISTQVIGLCAQCHIEGFHRIRDYEKAQERDTEGVSQKRTETNRLEEILK